MVFKFLNISTLKNFKNSATEVAQIPLASRVTEWVDIFNGLNGSVNTTTADFEKLYQKIGNDSVSNYFKNIQKQGRNAVASIDGVYLSLAGQTKGYKNVNRIIKEYNSITDSTGKTQQNYAKQIGATNSSFGQYLLKVGTAKASTLGYAGSLALATVKMIGLQMAQMAIVAIIQVIITGISLLVKSQQEAIDKAKEASEAVKSQAEETLDYIIYHTKFTYSFSSP